VAKLIFDNVTIFKIGLVFTLISIIGYLLAFAFDNLVIVPLKDMIGDLERKIGYQDTNMASYNVGSVKYVLLTSINDTLGLMCAPNYSNASYMSLVNFFNARIAYQERQLVDMQLAHITNETIISKYGLEKVNSKLVAETHSIQDKNKFLENISNAFSDEYNNKRSERDSKENQLKALEYGRTFIQILSSVIQSIGLILIAYSGVKNKPEKKKHKRIVRKKVTA
jgi:hypothetical protein